MKRSGSQTAIVKGCTTLELCEVDASIKDPNTILPYEPNPLLRHLCSHTPNLSTKHASKYLLWKGLIAVFDIWETYGSYHIRYTPFI